MMPYFDDSHSTNFICDCKPAHVYDHESDSCYKLYKQEFCPEHYYINLPENESNPICEKNVCLKSGLVQFKSACYALGSQEPCVTKSGENGGFLIVNATNLKLECSYKILPYHIIKVPTKTCLRGSRRNILGICRRPV